MSNARLRSGGEELATSIAEVLAEFDIMGLRDSNPDIVDEYRPEAEDLAKHFQKALREREPVSLQQVREVLAGTFEYWFETKFSPAELEASADKLHQLLSERQ